MKIAVVATALLLSVATLIAARALPILSHASTSSHGPAVVAHASGPITSAQQAIADAAPGLARVWSGDPGTIQGVTAAHVSTTQLNQMMMGERTDLPDETSWWVVTYPGIALPVPNPNHMVHASEPAFTYTPGHLSVIVDPLTGSPLGEFTW